MKRALLLFRLVSVVYACFICTVAGAGDKCDCLSEMNLIEALSDERLRHNDPDAYVAAIECLGARKSVAAVNALVALLDYRRSYTDWQSAQEMTLRTHVRASFYPAVDALATIGEPALPSVAQALAASGVDTERYRSASDVFLAVFWLAREDGASFLEKEAAGRPSDLERERLLRAAERLRMSN
ncbi:MAG TPA: hypothetical protein VLU25_12820 [Acidobacteriota bacterium]|nr:hypothetical protein [Acidobacteriota bacterium]